MPSPSCARVVISCLSTATRPAKARTRPRGPSRLRHQLPNENPPCPPTSGATAELRHRGKNVGLSGRRPGDGHTSTGGSPHGETALAGKWFRSIVPRQDAPAEIDTGLAHPARIYNYWLRRKDKYSAGTGAARPA